MGTQLTVQAKVLGERLCDKELASFLHTLPHTPGIFVHVPRCKTLVGTVEEGKQFLLLQKQKKKSGKQTVRSLATPHPSPSSDLDNSQYPSPLVFRWVHSCRVMSTGMQKDYSTIRTGLGTTHQWILGHAPSPPPNGTSRSLIIPSMSRPRVSSL